MNTVPSMENRFLEKLVQVVEENFTNDQFQVTILASEMGMSRATLHRKVKAVTGKTVSQFINEVRLDAAKQLLTNRSGTVSEIAYMVGFGSSTYFIKCFRDHFGYSPGEVLKENFQAPVITIEKHKSSKNKIPVSLKIGAALLSIVIIFLFINYFNINAKSKGLPLPSTNNQAALNLYWQGISLMDVYSGSQDPNYFMEAKQKYSEALVLDSTFGDAYSQLATIYLSYIPFSEQTYKGFDYIDSGRICIEKAEHFGVGDEDHLLHMKSIYFQQIQNYDEALRLFELRWKNREKDYIYHSEGGNHAFLMQDYAATIQHIIKYLSLKPKREMTDYDLLVKLTLIFSRAGFQQEAMEFAFRQFELINDSLKYRNWRPRIFYECGKLGQAISYYEAAHRANELSTTVYNKLLELYLLEGRMENGLELLPEYLAYTERISPAFMPNYLLGYYHFLNKENTLAEEHFRNEIQRWEFFCEMNSSQENITNYLTIAACYSMLQKKEGLIESLKRLNKKTSIPFLVIYKLQNSPMFDNFRNDKDFMAIKKEIEYKFQNEQTTIIQLLEQYPIEFSSKTNLEVPFI